VTTRDDDLVPLLVDSSRPFPLLLQDGAWAKAGVDVHTLAPLPDDPTIKRGIVPMFRIGGYDLAKMPAIEGVDLHELTSGIDIDLGGVVGADLLAFFRITFADDGRFMWLEPDPSLLNPNQRAPQGAPAGPPPGAPPGPAPGSATAPSAPPASQPPASSR
jgi:hypothetical protein